MRRTIYILTLFIIIIASCTPKNIISKGDMSDILYDFYMADRYLEDSGRDELGDSVKVYIPILDEYGYSYDDYLSSMDYYLHKPEDLTKIFKEVESELMLRKEYLQYLIEEEQNRMKRWKLLDSLDMYGNDTLVGNGYYRALRLLFFKIDTLEVTSPTIDSVILNHIQYPYFVYDSLPELYDSIPPLLSRVVPVDTTKTKLQKDTSLFKPTAKTRSVQLRKPKFNDKKEDFR